MKVILPAVFHLLYITIPVTLQANEIENIIVSSTRGQPVNRVLPVGVRVITREEIQLGGATTLPDILRGTSAIHISDLFGDGSNVSLGLRGFSETAQQNTLVMVDGRRLNNADNGLLDFNTIAIENIERIEIIKGSAGTLYGDKAVGGVINIIMRSPDKPGFSTGMHAGSFENRKIFAAIENFRTDGIYYGINGSRHLSNNYRDHNKFRLSDLSLKAGYQNPRGAIEFLVQALDENIQAPGALFADQLDNDRLQSQNNSDFTNSDTLLTRLDTRYLPVPGLELQTEITRRQKSVQGTLSSGGFPSDFTQYREHIEVTPRLIFTGMPDWILHRFTIGADLFKTKYNITSPFGITDDAQIQAGIYFQAVLDLSDSVIVTLGGRHNRVMNDIYVDTLAFGRSLAPGTEIDDNANAWEAGLSWQLDEQWRVYGRADSNFRFVTADEYSAVADNNFFSRIFAAGMQIPLPVTQTGMSYETGLEWNRQKTRSSIEIYRLELDNEIVFNPLVFLNTNIGSTVRTGIIFEADIMPAESLNIGLSYSYIDAEVTSGTYDNAELTYLADHLLKLSSSYHFTENLSGYIEINTTSERILGGDFSGALPALPGYEVVNLNLLYKRQSLELSFRLNNMLNHSYSDSGNVGFDYRNVAFPQVSTFFPAPGRNFMFSVSYTHQH